MKQMTLDMGLAQGPTLAGFMPGPNQPVLEHLRLWLGPAGQPTSRSPVPTYLWGPQGSGKSHLLLALREALRERGEHVGWLAADVHEPGPYQDGWVAVLLDDVHRYTAVQQQAAFNWFIHAQSVQAGIVAAGAWPAADLVLREDLRTRLGWGHVYALQVLSDAERRAVLRQQSDARGVFLSDEVMDYILSRFSRDLGSLMQLLAQLDGYSLQTQRAITIPLIKSMLENE